MSNINIEENYSLITQDSFKQIPVDDFQNLKLLSCEHEKSTSWFNENQPVTSSFGLMFKCFIHIFFTLRRKDINHRMMERVVKKAKTFFFIIHKCFPKFLNKPSVHDTIHLLFDQMQNVIAPAFCNTAKTEAINKEHRLAAQAGNNMYCEFIILLNQWTSRFLQCLADAAYFKVNDNFTPTGTKTLDIVRSLFCNEKSPRIQIDDSFQKMPHLPPNWWRLDIIPSVCRDGVTIKLSINENKKRKIFEFGDKNSGLITVVNVVKTTLITKVYESNESNFT